jgi:type I restriction enzyme S subunit
LNSLPQQWIVKEIGQVGEVVAGGTPSTKKNEYWGMDVCWITPLDLSGYKEKYISKGRKSLTKLGLEKSSARLIPKGSILFSSRAPIGYVAIAANELATNQGFKNLIPSPIIESDFLYYYFKSIKKMAYELASGTTFKELSAARFAKIPVPVPHKKEQQVIVEKIEELFSDLDNAVENLQKARAQLKVYRQSILKNAFEGKLTNKNVKEGELPKGWKLVRIEEIADVGTGATPLKSNKSYYENGKIPWITSGALNDLFVRDATDFVNEKAIRETNLKVYPKHTLLLAMYGEGKTRGKCSELLIDACTNQAIAAIYFTNHDNRIKPYLKYYLLKNYDDIRKLASGGVQPNLNLGIVKNTILSVPPSFEEQKAIVAEIESRFSVCDQMEETIETSLKQAEALRQSILKQAFEGKLTEQWRKDHTDLISGENSAVALLAKIKTEKEKLTNKKRSRK